MDNCELCTSLGGELIWSDDSCRVVLVNGPDAARYPGFCRVIWNDHVAEMSDLTPAERAHLMHIVFTTEAVVRKLMRPEKINLASLGNMVPHLHWHIIPRWHNDCNFPHPIWAVPVRNVPARAAIDKQQFIDQLLVDINSGM